MNIQNNNEEWPDTEGPSQEDENSHEDFCRATEELGRSTSEEESVVERQQLAEHSDGEHEETNLLAITTREERMGNFDHSIMERIRNWVLVARNSTAFVSATANTEDEEPSYELLGDGLHHQTFSHRAILTVGNSRDQSIMAQQVGMEIFDESMMESIEQQLFVAQTPMPFVVPTMGGAENEEANYEALGSRFHHQTPLHRVPPAHIRDPGDRLPGTVQQALMDGSIVESPGTQRIVGPNATALTFTMHDDEDGEELGFKNANDHKNSTLLETAADKATDDARPSRPGPSIAPLIPPLTNQLREFNGEEKNEDSFLENVDEKKKQGENNANEGDGNENVPALGLVLSAEQEVGDRGTGSGGDTTQLILPVIIHEEQAVRRPGAYHQSGADVVAAGDLEAGDSVMANHQERAQEQDGEDGEEGAPIVATLVAEFEPVTNTTNVPIAQVSREGLKRKHVLSLFFFLIIVLVVVVAVVILTRESTIVTLQPSALPSSNPTTAPSASPTDIPSLSPSEHPTFAPTIPAPSSVPSSQPSLAPSPDPTSRPSLMASFGPTDRPSSTPSLAPTDQPSLAPTDQPSLAPSLGPTMWPSSMPSFGPTTWPSSVPSSGPFNWPSSTPSLGPTDQPSSMPSFTDWPSSTPSFQPSTVPSITASFFPSFLSCNICGDNNSRVSNPEAVVTVIAFGEVTCGQLQRLGDVGSISIFWCGIIAVQLVAVGTCGCATPAPSMTPSTLPSTTPSVAPSISANFVIGTSIATTVPVDEQRMITLPNVTTITFPADTFTAPETIVMISADLPTFLSTRLFDESASIFNPASSTANSFQVSISVSSVPITETISASIAVPSNFIARVADAKSIKAAVTAQQGAGITGARSFVVFTLVNSTFDASTNELFVDIPSASFSQLSPGATDGEYQATIILSETSSLPRRHLQDDEEQKLGCQYRHHRLQTSDVCGEASNILCPVSGGCTVVVRFNDIKFHPEDSLTPAFYGTTFSAPEGTAILAASAGTVIQATTSRSLADYGNFVMIRHADGTSTLYANLAHFIVSEGSVVSAGSPIGTIGNTGFARSVANPQLHFEYATNKARIDPDACIASTTPGPTPQPTVAPSGSPSWIPSLFRYPSDYPSFIPSTVPTHSPSSHPSGLPTISPAPSSLPSPAPTALGPHPGCPSSNDIAFRLRILTDNSAVSETSVSLVSDDGALAILNKPVGSLPSGADLHFDECVASINCWLFTINDMAGNGLFRNSFYAIELDGVEVIRNGSFGSQETYQFGLCFPSATPSESPAPSPMPTESPEPSPGPSGSPSSPLPSDNPTRVSSTVEGRVASVAPSFVPCNVCGDNDRRVSVSNKDVRVNITGFGDITCGGLERLGDTGNINGLWCGIIANQISACGCVTPAPSMTPSASILPSISLLLSLNT